MAETAVYTPILHITEPSEDLTSAQLAAGAWVPTVLCWQWRLSLCPGWAPLPASRLACEKQQCLPEASTVGLCLRSTFLFFATLAYDSVPQVATSAVLSKQNPGAATSVWDPGPSVMQKPPT